MVLLLFLLLYRLLLFRFPRDPLHFAIGVRKEEDCCLSLSLLSCPLLLLLCPLLLLLCELLALFFFFLLLLLLLLLLRERGEDETVATGSI